MKRAAILLALAGCKADLHQTVDAQPLDAAIDSLSPNGDPPANAVKLTVTRGTAPVVDVAVFFQGADSSLISASLTNDKGVAWAVMPAGGFVTAVQHAGTGLDHLSTFASVQPADSLELDLSPPGSASPHLLQITVPTAANAVSYLVHTPCGSEPMGSETADITLVGCGVTTDLVIVPQDVDGVALGALFAPGVNVDGGPATITGSYQSFANVSVSYTNVPAFVTFIGVYEALSAEQRAFARSEGVTPAGGLAQVDVSMPQSTATELTVSNLFPTAGEIGIQTIYGWHPASATVDVDVGSVLLPAYATAPEYQVATRRIAFTTRAGVMPDVVRGQIRVHRDNIPSGRAWDWRIVAPYESGITFPKLPVFDFDFNPLGGDTITIGELSSISVPGGYAGFRAQGFAEARSVAISGTLGRIVQQDLYFESL
jgi:hypothetical protein